jgi:hypothetical protein
VSERRQDEATQPASVFRSRGYEHVSYYRVYCTADCGYYLSREEGSWSRTTHRRYAACFPDADKAWQAARSAGWANVLLPGHDPHKHGPYGPKQRMFYCDQSGAGDCQEVREYKDATVCPECRGAGWFPW